MSESLPPSGPVRVQNCAAHPSSDDVANACMTADCLTSALDPTMLPSLIMTAPRHATEVDHIMTMSGPEHPPTAKEPAGDHAMPTRDRAASQKLAGCGCALCGVFPSGRLEIGWQVARGSGF